MSTTSGFRTAVGLDGSLFISCPEFLKVAVLSGLAVSERLLLLDLFEDAPFVSSVDSASGAEMAQMPPRVPSSS